MCKARQDIIITSLNQDEERVPIDFSVDPVVVGVQVGNA